MVTMQTVPMPTDSRPLIDAFELTAVQDDPTMPDCPIWATAPTIAWLREHVTAHIPIEGARTAVLAQLMANLIETFLRSCPCGRCSADEPHVRHVVIQRFGAQSAECGHFTICCMPAPGARWENTRSVLMTQEEWDAK